MFDIRDLTEAHRKFRDFPSYRAQKRSELDGKSGTRVSELREAILTARTEKAVAVAKADTAIAEARLELAKLGQAGSLAEIRRNFDQDMRIEKEEVRAGWFNKVHEAKAAGMTPRQILEAVPTLNSLPSIYNILGDSSKAAAQADEQVATAVPDTVLGDVVWTYSEHRPVHRYAVNEDKSLIKFHGPHVDDQHVVVTYPGLEYVNGDRTLVGSVDATRVQTLLQVLYGSTDGMNPRNSANPYAE